MPAADGKHGHDEAKLFFHQTEARKNVHRSAPILLILKGT